MLRLTSPCRAVARAFYEDVPDAQLVSRSDLSGDIWQIPCDKEVNVTFKFGGVSFPIHPLDANIDLNATDSDGNHVCFGAVRPRLRWHRPCPLTVSCAPPVPADVVLKLDLRRHLRHGLPCVWFHFRFPVSLTLTPNPSPPPMQSATPTPTSTSATSSTARRTAPRTRTSSSSR